MCEMVADVSPDRDGLISLGITIGVSSFMITCYLIYLGILSRIYDALGCSREEFDLC